jgi:tetratricopeptide (TPR) repeat protein
MPYQPTWQERLEDLKIYVGPAIALSIVLGMGGWLTWRHFHPPAPLPVAAMPADETRGDAAVAASADKAPAADAGEAERLHESVSVAQSLATAAAARGSWPEALKAYQQARTAQAALNEHFPQTRFADAAALERIDAEIASASAAELAGRSLAAERDGDTASAAHRTQDASIAYTQALELQRELNEKFPRARTASVARVEALARKREIVRATAATADLAAIEQQLELLLRHREVAAAQDKIEEAAALLERTARAYPQGVASIDALRRQKIDFLNSLRGDLLTLQRDTDALLVTLGGFNSLRMLRTEVPQEMFIRLMGSNPSRNRAPTLPVDSVTWAETQEFCRRLSWVLGLPVRLPTEAEFRAAAAGPAGKDAPWSADNAAGHTHEVGLGAVALSGVADLHGNVAEWLQPAANDATRAPVAGGSFLDPASTVATLPFTLVDKRERARHVGFRVVVEPAP